MLGTIDDTASRALIVSILGGKDAWAITDTLAGLNGQQCLSYLPDLTRAAQEPKIEYKGGILSAIARAGTTAAAQVIAGIADNNESATAGMAFGALEGMGAIAEPALTGVVTNGRSAWARETAAYILRRMKDPSTVTAFRSALRDPDEKVRIAGALGLAQFGVAEGKRQLEAAASVTGNDDQVEEALVALATLGSSEAIERLKALVTSSDTAVRVHTVWAIARSQNASLKNFAYRLGLERQPILNTLIADELFDPNDPRDRSALHKMAEGSDEMAQLAAARVLLRAGSSSEAELIVGRALSSQDGPSRQQAITIAAAHAELRTELARHLSSPDPLVQAAALSAIAELGDRGRFAEVATYLESGDRGVSEAAAKALAALDPAAAKPVLEQGLDSQTSHARVHSAAMLLAIAARGQVK
jgi:HEAT repeat protein